MLKLLAVVVFLGISAQARQLLQAADPRPRALITADSVYMNADDGLTFTVTFDKCVSAPSASDFVISPALNVRVADATVEELADDQMWKIRIPLVRPAHQSAVKVSVFLPAGAVTGSANQQPNQQSNAFTTGAMWAMGGGVLKTDPDTFNYDKELITYMYTFPGHKFAPRDPKFLITANEDSQYSPESVSYGKLYWKFTVRAQKDDNVVARVLAGSAVDPLGHVSDASNVVNTLIAPPSDECQVSAWSDWSQCTKTCVGYTARFEYAGGMHSRSRTVVAPGILACPPLQESERCNDVICPTGKGARPFSGESAADCTSATGTQCRPRDPARGDPNREKNGCACDTGCIARQDCCQAFFSKNCCSEGDCVNNFSQFVYSVQFPNQAYPMQCPSSACGSVTPLVASAGEGSYFCYCDAQCTVESDRSCCGGTAARNAVCGAGNGR